MTRGERIPAWGYNLPRMVYWVLRGLSDTSSLADEESLSPYDIALVIRSQR